MLNLDNIVGNKNENKNNNWPFRILQDQVKLILYFI